MGKNDLSGILQKKKSPILQKESQQKPGRKKKPIDEKETELVPLRLTPREYQILTKKAGLAKVTTYLKYRLRNETDILSEEE